MKRLIQTRITHLAITLAAVAPLCVLHAQRLRNPIDGRSKIILRGSRNPRIDGLASDGRLDDVTPIHGMSLRFRPTAAQSADLERLLEQQQDPSSPLYHAWLKPEEYGERFGLSVSDLAKVADWVVSQGFRIDYKARSRTHLTFSGTAGQVRDAFGTELHRYTVNGKKRFANVRDVMVPAELEPLLYAVSGLDDIHEAHVTPKVTRQDGSHAVTPLDLAVIYDIGPLIEAGIQGAGQNIVVVGRSALSLQDYHDFGKAYGFLSKDPKVLLVPGSDDPGMNDDGLEAMLDVDYASGAAPLATIIYVYGTNDNDAVGYAVDQNLAPVISQSFGLCEAQQSGWPWMRSVAQQANAQGMTWVSSAGDSGAAGCESPETDRAGVRGLAVAVPASFPEVTGVGGTEFVEGNGQYWSSRSAQSYIPEKAWNDTASGSFLNAGGGGISSLFSRPCWQVAAGLPNDNARHVPDVAFTASGDHDPYLLIYQGKSWNVGGTSASTPFFAGVLALVNQFVVGSGIQAQPGLGNINPVLYQLAQTTKGVFHDVTTGNNIVPCQKGTPDCTNGQFGYSAGPGYDNVTGLGSIDVANLLLSVAGQPTTSKSGSVVTVSVDPSPVYQTPPDENGFSWNFTVTLKETGGAPTTVTAFAFDDIDLSDYIADWFGSTTLGAHATLSADLGISDIDVPSDHVISFSGVDASGQEWTKQIKVSFLGPKSVGTSAAMSLTSDPAVVVKVGDGDPDCPKDHPYGQTLYLKETNGSAVNLTKFVIGGYDYTTYIGAWFGSQTLPASGTLNGKLCWKLSAVPVTLDYEMDGTDGSGDAVQATLKVDFKDPLDQKSGGAHSETTLLSRGGRSLTPHRTSSGMTVGLHTAVGSAVSPVK